jgi:L,D-peptidoglycan transpeptidase YkuD (ErfK/YbiS/YcfS/YnhG family)
MAANKITRDILLAALAGFQLERQRIDAQIAEVEAMLDGPSKAPAVISDAAPQKRKGKRSLAVRRRMAEAQKARWAKVKGESEAVGKPGKTKAAKKSVAKKAPAKKARKKSAAVPAPDVA